MTKKVLSHNFSNSISSTKEVIELQLLFLNISNSFAKIFSSNKPLELRPGKEVQWSIAGRISMGWISLPIIAAIIYLIVLFILENIFNLTVSF